MSTRRNQLFRYSLWRVLECLLNNGTNVDSCDNKGRSPHVFCFVFSTEKDSVTLPSFYLTKALKFTFVMRTEWVLSLYLVLIGKAFTKESWECKIHAKYNTLQRKLLTQTSAGEIKKGSFKWLVNMVVKSSIFIKQCYVMVMWTNFVKS